MMQVTIWFMYDGGKIRGKGLKGENIYLHRNRIQKSALKNSLEEVVMSVLNILFPPSM
jgi:hypothetical protein